MPELLKIRYTILSQISFHLHTTQDGGEKYVVSLSRIGKTWLCSAFLAINLEKRSNLRRRILFGCWSNGQKPDKSAGARNNHGVNRRNWVRLQHKV